MSVPTGLYLDFQVEDGLAANARRLLAAAVEAAPIASVLVRSVDNRELSIATAHNLIAFLQKRGIAALISPEAGDALKLGADGIHLGWASDIVRQFKMLRQTMPVEAIIGADAGRSRHDAMELGEAGADYVAFGIPPHVEDRKKAAERQHDLITWWSELFEIPCVAFDVIDSAIARSLAIAGADFVSVRVTSRDSETDAAARVREFSDALRMPEPAK